MCLEKVKERNDVPSMTIISGWKDFGNYRSGLEFRNISLNNSKKVEMDKWIIAEKKTINATDGTKYDTGFHVWTEEKELTSKNLTHVYIRKISTIGIQEGLTVAIAEEMYVPSDPNDWPPKPGDPPKKESLLDKTKKMIGKAGNA
jgi:hypothetical protein